MENITIHADQVTVHLHAAPVAGTLIESTAAELLSGEVTELPERLATASHSDERFLKVFADGTVANASDPRTDHVAVKDRVNGLLWSVESLGNPDDAEEGITQEHCAERCRELRLLSYDDWRMPTRAELASLIDDTRHEPAIDTNLFPRVKARWHWTSTPCAWSSASAWLVNFGYGGVSNGHRSGDGFALAVRRVGQ
jgi:hypothetical protein